MKLKILVIMALVLSLSASSYAALTYEDTYYQRNLGNVLSGGSTDPIKLFINEAEGYLEGTTAFPSLYFSPTDVAPTAAEGVIYWSDADNALKLYTGTAWVDIDVSGASSLATAYTAGSKILAPTLAVEIEVADGSDNGALILDSDDTSDAIDVLTITNAGDDAAAVSIQISGTAGYDIQGTSDTWNVSIAGVAGFVGATIGNSDLVFTEPTTNDVTLLADGDAILTISATSKEDIDINLATSNVVGFTSSTGVVSVNWGALDQHTGLNDLVFDGATANTITQTGTGEGDDLTISQAASAQDASLILQSSGTGTDALSLISSVADIKANSAGNIDIDAADNITVNTADGSYTLTIAGSTNGNYSMTAADTMSFISVDSATFQTTAAEADITINSVLGSIAIEAEEDAASAVLITADGGTSSTMKLHNDTGTAAGSIELNSDVGGIQIIANAAGKDVDIDSILGSIYIEAEENAANAILITADGGTTTSMKLHNDTGASVAEGASSIQLLSDAGGIGLESNANLAKSIWLIADGGATETILIESQHGTGACAAGEVDAAVQLYSLLGGIGLTSKLNADNSIRIETNGGDDENIIIHSHQGTGADSITLVTDEGGIALTGTAGPIVLTADDSTAGDITIDAEDKITIVSADLAAEGIYIHENATSGTSGSIKVHADKGTGDESIYLASDVGGITLKAAAGSIDIEPTGEDAGDLGITVGDDMTVTVAGDLTFAITGSTILPDDVLRKATVAVTANEADNLAASPKELVAAEAGKMHEFVKVIVALDWGATAYTESEDNLAVRYHDGSGVIVSDVIEATGLADATEDTVCFAGPAPTTSALVTEANSTNKALVLDNTGNGEWGNSGDSPLVVIIYYRTHTTAELGL